MYILCDVAGLPVCILCVCYNHSSVYVVCMSCVCGVLGLPGGHLSAEPVEAGPGGAAHLPLPSPALWLPLTTTLLLGDLAGVHQGKEWPATHSRHSLLTASLVKQPKANKWLSTAFQANRG